MDDMAWTIRTRRGRRTAEEKLLEEAREQVFRGADPKEPESEALALVIHESKVKMTGIGKKQQKQKAANTAGSSQAQHRSQGQSSSKTVIPLDLDGKMSQMPSPNENRGCEQPPVSTTGNISQSLALMPAKKTAPTRSTGAAIPVKEKAPAVSNRLIKKKRQKSSMTNSSPRFSLSANLNTDWREFTQVVEGVVDEVLVRMLNRTEEEKARKIAMKAALLQVIFQQIPCSRATAIVEKRIGRSTLQGYANEVKARLEACLGQQVVDDDFLKQFHNNNRQQLTLGQLRTALLKAGKITTQEQGSSSSGKENRKRQLSIAAPPSSLPADPRLAHQQNATGSKVKKPVDIPTASAAKRSRTKEPRQQAQKQQKAIAGIGSQQQPAGTGGDIPMLLLQPGAGNNKELLTRQNTVRKRFRGTERQLRKKIFELAERRYKGEPVSFTDTLYGIMVKSKEIKELMEKNDMPQELVSMGFRMLHSEYEGVDNPEILPDGQSDEEDE